MTDLTTYFATRCRNSEPGSFNHECGAPAVFFGRHPDGHEAPYCNRCRATGTEARRCVSWRPAEVWTVRHPVAGWLKDSGHWSTFERNAGTWKTREEAEAAARASQGLNPVDRRLATVRPTNPAFDPASTARGS